MNNVEVFSFSFVTVFCKGILILSFNEISKVLTPNKPESKGNKGSFKVGRFKVIIPKTPAKRMINVAAILFPLSFISKKITEAINR